MTDTTQRQQELKNPSGETFIRCECGQLNTTNIDYARLHFTEGTCKPTEKHIQVFRHRRIAIDREITSLQERVSWLRNEANELCIIESLAELPLMPKKFKRPCRICQKFTLDRFEELPQCAEHVGSNALRDLMAKDVLSMLKEGM